jgi:hypothetical protein
MWSVAVDCFYLFSAAPLHQTQVRRKVLHGTQIVTFSVRCMPLFGVSREHPTGGLH